MDCVVRRGPIEAQGSCGRKAHGAVGGDAYPACAFSTVSNILKHQQKAWFASSIRASLF
jgi:hypothetical protein